MTNKRDFNNVCQPKEPENAESVANRVLKHLLAGRKLNRKQLANYRITANNCSLHSTISTLRNKRLIPVESDQQADGTCDYFMAQEEIERFINPRQREHQREEMAALVERNRQARAIHLFNNLMEQIAKSPEIFLKVKSLHGDLRHISQMLNSLLRKVKKH